MATVTEVVNTVATAAQTLSAIEAKVQGLLGDAAKAKAQVVSALEAHVAAHNADIAKHQAEVDAAAILIARASPGTTQEADKAAAFVLTSSSQVQGVVNFLGKNWRYVVVGLSLAVTAYGVVVLHVLR